MVKSEHRAEGGSKAVDTPAELRDALFDELDRLRNGESTPAQANEIAGQARQVIKSMKKRPRGG
jgi:hypothetical protein